jgi:hypothetical protein
MALKKIIQKILKIFKKSQKKEENQPIYETEAEEKEETIKIYSIWDFLNFIENTQAFHLKSVIGFNEWVSMDEIMRRIQEVFNIKYKNERSLYPYIKTMTDIGLLETINVGGKRKWRKKEILIKIKEKEKKTKKEEEKELIVS